MTEAPATTVLDTSDVDRYINQPLPSVQLLDPVAPSDIRRWAQGMQYPNPLHYDDEAAALGVSRRTLQRQAARLLELGPAGLVDSRLLQQSRRSVDPRWDSACLDVLAAHRARHHDG